MVLLVVVVVVVEVVVLGAGDLPSPTLGLALCLCLCLLGRVGRVGLVGLGLGSLGLVTLLPSLTSPRSDSLWLSPSLSRLKISRRRGDCLRGCSVSRITGAELVVVEGEVGPNVGKNGVAVVAGGSVGTLLSEMVGRNTEEVSASKLTSSSSSEL